MASKSQPLDSNTVFTAHSPSDCGSIKTKDGTKQVQPLSSKSKWAMAAFFVGGVAGVVIVILGTTNFFGPVGSFESIVSIAGGGILTLIAIGGATFVLCKFKPEVQKQGTESETLSTSDRINEIQPVNNQSQIEAPRATVYFVSDQAYTEHITGSSHPEKPERVTSINDALEQAGLKDKNNSLSPRLATVEEIGLCHDADYIKKVETEIDKLKPQETTNLSTGDVVISQRSLHAASLAVGGVLTAVDQVFTNETSKAFCVVRPPGHHASCARGAGFCIFNNVAIAARYAQQKYHVKRVLIVDWDVHHGDGTQNIFYTDPSVFYFSTHEAGNYPNTGKMDETGAGKGTGFTMNIPIPGNRTLENRKGTGAKVIDAFNKQLTNAMNHFQPEFILISCGFDGHKDDPLGGFDLTNEDYATLTTCINQIANKYAQGRVVSVLEGGYNLKAIAEASVSHVRALIET